MHLPGLGQAFTAGVPHIMLRLKCYGSSAQQQAFFKDYSNKNFHEVFMLISQSQWKTRLMKATLPIMSINLLKIMVL